MKQCTTCGEVKPCEAYYKRAASNDGLMSSCKACTSKKQAAYYAVNRDRVLARVATRNEGREAEKAEYDAKYRAKNGDRIAEGKAEYYRANSARITQQGKEYHDANPHVGWLSKYRSRARKYGHLLIEEQFTKADVLERYGDKCHYCDGGEFQELDHYVAVKVGGSHTLDNVRPCCRKCNMRRARGLNRKEAK